MNQRQRKKRDKKLMLAIRELNNDVAQDLGIPNITDDKVINVFNKIIKNPDSINQTFSHYKKYILNR